MQLLYVLPTNLRPFVALQEGVLTLGSFGKAKPEASCHSGSPSLRAITTKKSYTVAGKIVFVFFLRGVGR